MGIDTSASAGEDVVWVGCADWAVMAWGDLWSGWCIIIIIGIIGGGGVVVEDIIIGIG